LVGQAGLLLPTLLADTDDLQSVSGRQKSVTLAHAVLKTLDPFVRKLYRPTASGADHVIVMLVAEDMLVVTVFLRGMNFPKKTAFYKKRERAVDARSRDTHPPTPQAVRNVVRLEVLVNAENLSQDELPLRRTLQPLTCNELAKHLLFGCFHSKLLLNS
jgi:hypothetical protein